MKEMKDNGLSIVLPVLNEKDIIERVIREIDTCASSLVGNIEIIVVNDGSRDGTLEVLESIRPSLPNLKIVSHQKNVGYGGALITGIKSAQKSWVLLMDSDDQLKIDSLQAVWPNRDEYDLLIGYRQKRADNFYRRILGKTGNTISNMFLGRHVKDINCGFKLFKKELIGPLSLISTGSSINFEILRVLFKKDPTLKMHQFPVKHYPRQKGTSTGGDLKVIYRLIIESRNILLNK